MMISYDEYVLHEHRKDLLREAAHDRLARLVSDERRLTKRFGWLLLAWGARFVAGSTSECQCVVNHAGQTVTVCPA